MKSDPRKAKAAESAPAAGGTTAGLGGPPRQTAWLRKLGLGVAASLGVVAVLTVGMEIGLRLGGYGYDTRFFKRVRIGEADFLVENDKFGLRFFPPNISRSPPPVRMTAAKPPGTYRIFLFGESAALGDPRPAYGAGRYLQVLLQERFPDTRFEVVCVAMTAINSHAILPIARECARYPGDLWLVYLGNNEMIGPFGATAVFGSRAPPLWRVRLGLAVQKWRVGQLLTALARKGSGQTPSGSWAGMQMFMENRVRPDDPRKAVVYANFQRNLADIVRAGRKAGARLILSTVAVNLKDCAPLAALSGVGLPEGESSAIERDRLAGVTAEGEGQLQVAARSYEQALRIDPQNAEVQFRLGRALLGLTNAADARPCFGKARDYDALPFRADSRINALIVEVGRQLSGPDVACFDAAAWFGTNSPDGIPGWESFFEHVHFNFEGNYRLARAWAEELEKLLPEQIRRAARESATAGAAGWAAQEVCERRLALTDWNRASVIEDMMRRLGQPPFTNQLNHARQLEALGAELRALRRRMSAGAGTVKEARAVYLQAIERAPADHRLHENFAEFLEETGDLATAAAEWQRVRELLPHHHLGYFEAGRLLARLGRLSEAQGLLRQAVTLRPDLSEGWLELGRTHFAEGKPEPALEAFDRARRLLPQDHRVYFHIGRALSKLNRRPEALQQFREALRLRPDYWEARYALGEELAFDGKVAEARAQFEAVIRQEPRHSMSHLNLGVALVQQGQLEEAVKQFEEAARLDPNNRLAQEYLQKVKGRKGSGL